MGIFSKRDIAKDEEITFNYNVDRYGCIAVKSSISHANAYRHDAQTCYCAEPNCVGTIGGKTQTDVGTINDLLLDGALPDLLSIALANRPQLWASRMRWRSWD